ncbi:MAG TPA: FctA domain-containing protein [Clostridia bacterium]|nr:FctA domain-containing protein [Clostridia bacterium]
MKKLLVIMLALTMVLSLSGIALAEEDYEDSNSVEVNKEMTLTNEETINPAETFSFTVGEGTVTGSSATSAPALPSPFTIDVAEGGASGSTNINLPAFNRVGVYTYPINETPGNTAGMDYDTGTNNLVITVTNNPAYDGGSNEPEFLRVLTMAGTDGKKIDAFTNTFSAGDLTITKETTGNFGDPEDEFTVTVKLTPPAGKDIKAGPIDTTGADSFTDNEDGTFTATYTVSHGSNFTLKNIPYGVGYTVEEEENDMEYTATYTGDEGAIDDATQTAAITNTRNTEVATGINLDNLPYILLLAVALGGLFLFGMRKRFGLVK